MGGNPVNLTGASVQFRMVAFGTLTPLIVNSAAVVTDTLGGGVQYEWQSADTETAGVYDALFKVTFGDGTIETFINSENIRVHIVPTF